MKKNFFDYLFVCHKLPHRSFFYKGKQFPVCARCTGIFIGYIIGLMIPFFYAPSILVTLLLFIPVTFDGSLQLFTKYESKNYRRLITGILTGVGTMFLLANLGQLFRIIFRIH